MHKQAIKHKQAIIGGGYLFTENACYCLFSEILLQEALVGAHANSLVLSYLRHATLSKVKCPSKGSKLSFSSFASTFYLINARNKHIQS